jgi:serine kinase of HPr protein (carbohydrate metabolism regulator)
MATIHATCLLIGPYGVMLRGPPGSGKSLLALALIERAKARGLPARLVSDDRIHLMARHGRVVARAPAETAGLVELRGHGIVTMPSEAAAVVRLVVDIVETPLERMPEPNFRRIAMEAVDLPGIEVPLQLEHAVQMVFAAMGTVCAR